MKNVITHDVKVKVAAAFIDNPSLKIKEAADKFDVSESSVRRFKSQYVDEAAELLKQKIAAKKKKAAEEIAVEATKKADTKETAKDEEVKPKRGYQGRNGRMAVLREAFAEFGLGGDKAELMVKVNDFCKEAGIKEMTKVQFNYFHYVFRKRAAEQQ